MFNFDSLGKFFIFLGLGFLGIGALFYFHKHIPYFGKLPGDFLIHKKNFTVFIPITTSILISLILSLILYLFTKK